MTHFTLSPDGEFSTFSHFLLCALFNSQFKPKKKVVIEFTDIVCDKK